MFNKIFRKDKRKEYIKLIGKRNFGRKELFQISLLSDKLSFEEFKVCVTPMVDEEKLRRLEKKDELDIKKFDAGLIPLKAEQIQALEFGFINGLSIEEVEMCKKPHLSSKDMENVMFFIELTHLSNENKRKEWLLEIERVTSKYNGKELESVLEVKRMKRFYGESLPDVVKEKFEEIYQYLPQEEKDKLIIGEDLANVLEYEILKDLRDNSQAKVFRYVDDYDYEIKPIKEDFVNITREEVDMELEKEKTFKELKEKEELTKDSDGDGLTDIEEKYIYNTNPYSRDTDGDGRSDLEEIKKDGTNPRIKDEVKKKKKKREREMER